jgi:calcineurin-like phosphoesterase family protein
LVGPKDEIYMLGDFAFAKEPKDVADIVSRLNGRKYLIFGNHDRSSVRHAEGFVWKKDLAKIKVQGQKIFLCHYAMRVWDASHYGSWNLYGHSHGGLTEAQDILACDVGVDSWDFKPVSFEQIKAKMDSKDFIPINERG